MRSLITTALLLNFACTAAANARETTTSDEHIALQMYTVRNVGSLEDQLAFAEKAGFRAVELVGDQGVNADVLKSALERHNLRVTSSHIQLSALRDSFDSTLAFNETIGNRVLIVPYLQPSERPSDAQGWQALGKELDKLGNRLRSRGFQLAYHNHDFEMKTYNGKTGFDWMVAATKPENLKLEVDAAWVFRGGQNPAALVRKYQKRLFALHAKDNAAIGVRDDEMNFAPLGEGLMDWPSVLIAAKDNTKIWYIIEHDKPKDPKAIVEAARLNLVSALNHN